MSDKPYRVPPGWSDEAAQLVREDWEAAWLSMSPPARPYVPNPPNLPDGATWLREGVYQSNDWPRIRQAWLRPEARHWPRIRLAWLRPEARLRAWAAVGAPVLAPAEDDKPSLAEWVAAAEGSALGRPRWCTPDFDHLEAGFRATQRQHIRVRFALPLIRDAVSGLDHALVLQSSARGPRLPDIGCRTPAALRAALDALAGER